MSSLLCLFFLKSILTNKKTKYFFFFLKLKGGFGVWSFSVGAHKSQLTREAEWVH